MKHAGYEVVKHTSEPSTGKMDPEDITCEPDFDNEGWGDWDIAKIWRGSTVVGHMQIVTKHEEREVIDLDISYLSSADNCHKATIQVPWDSEVESTEAYCQDLEKSDSQATNLAKETN